MHRQSIEQLHKLFGPVVQLTSLSEILGADEPPTFDSWFETYCLIQWSEIENSLGPWIADTNPKFGPVTTKNFELIKGLDRRRVPPAIARREHYYRAMRAFLGPRDLLCIPTTPAPAPIKGSLGMDQRVGDYYRRALSLTSIAGLSRLPQVSMPLSTVQVGDEAGLPNSSATPSKTAPVGLSLLASFGEDIFLLDVVCAIAAALGV
jgi:amidase